ncbi:unnamed protein product [Brachionus calyciflorus]|uniref:Uncharacterized protein n=1 Tax=Brachionus calyciflorus TaxID=104777 RepID=A0A813QNG6_9BILA|nr:unnamed protein product [Brachionus calyciflorus]
MVVKFLVFLGLILITASAPITKTANVKINSRSIVDVFYRTFYPDYKFLKEDYSPKFYDYNNYNRFNYKPYNYDMTYEYIPYDYDYPARVYERIPYKYEYYRPF